LGHSGSFKVRAGVKTSLVTDSENEIVLTAPFDGTVAGDAMVRYRLDGTIASAFQILLSMVLCHRSSQHSVPDDYSLQDIVSE